MPRPSKHISPDTLGGRIRAAREEQHLSLADVAGDQYSTSLISQIERNRVDPSHESLRFLAEQLKLPLEELEMLPDKAQGQVAVDQRRILERLSVLIQQLKPLDRQVIISYLEDMDAISIGEITGLSPGNVAMRIHRIKNILARRFHEGGNHAE